MPDMIDNSAKHRRGLLIPLSALLPGVMLFTWLRFAPPGLAGKLWAIGYSVCHQIASHSYIVGGVQLPLCARCTGLFLGAWITLTFLATRSRKCAFPKAKYRWMLLVILLAYAADGLNSALFEIAPSLSLYPPSNLLRLTTGVLMGIALGVLLTSLWNQILWKDGLDVPALNSIREWFILLAAGGSIVLMVNLGWNSLYYPLALLSTAGVVILLSAVYTLLWTLGLKKENTLMTWTERPWIFLLGAGTAMVQIALVDGLRLLLTHTWAGIAL